VVLAALRGLSAEIVACTDAGRAKWVERFANDLALPAAFVFKRRREEGTEVSAVSAQVSGKRVVIYDDLIRSGGSLLAAAGAHRRVQRGGIGATHEAPAELALLVEDEGCRQRSVPGRLADGANHRVGLGRVEEHRGEREQLVVVEHLPRLHAVVGTVDADEK